MRLCITHGHHQQGHQKSNGHTCGQFSTVHQWCLAAQCCLYMLQLACSSHSYSPAAACVHVLTCAMQEVKAFEPVAKSVGPSQQPAEPAAAAGGGKRGGNGGGNRLVVRDDAAVLKEVRRFQHLCPAGGATDPHPPPLPSRASVAPPHPPPAHMHSS